MEAPPRAEDSSPTGNNSNAKRPPGRPRKGPPQVDPSEMPAPDLGMARNGADIHPDELPGADDEPLDTDPAPNFEAGVGIGAGAPDPHRIGTAKEEHPLDMGPIDRGAGAGRRPSLAIVGEGPLGSEDEDIEPLAKAMSRMGARLRLMVTRLVPEGMPPSERGPHGWFEIPGEAPSPDQIREMVRTRFGGGQFEISIADKDPGEFGKRVRTVIDIGGDPVPFTFEGRAWCTKTYGAIPTGASLSGAPTLPMPGLDNGPFGLMGMWLQTMQENERRRTESMDKDKDRENSLATTVLAGLAQRPAPGAGLVALIPLALPILEFLRGMRADAREERERAEQRMLATLEKQKSPVDMMTMIQPILALQQKRAEIEMEDYSKRSDKLFDQMLLQFKNAGREEDVTFLGVLKDLLKERGGDILTGAMPLLMGMMSGKTAEQAATMFGMNPDQMRMMAARGAAAQVARPQVISQGMPARPPLARPQPDRPRMVATPPPPAQSAPPGAPTGPGPVAPEIPGGPPAPSDPNPPVGEPQAPEEPQGDRQRLPHPGEFARRASMQSLQQFLFYSRGFSESMPDPDAAWSVVFDGQTMEVLFGLSPLVFRQKVQKTNPEQPFLVEDWAAGAPEDILAIAREFDAYLASSGPSREWIAAFLNVGPWVEEEDDGDEDPE